MHLVIDDTYGPKTNGQSRYVTGNRRTCVALRFKDDEVEYVRNQLKECLAHVSSIIGKPLTEFHFTEIFNRRGQWAQTEDGLNLKIFGFFAELYSIKRWPVMLQTVDDRTFVGHNVSNWAGKIDGLDLTDRYTQSLVLLCMRFQRELPECEEPLTVLVDQGLRKPGAPFGKTLFREWKGQFRGEYVASTEPLMQLTDFVAYCINRSTVLQIKSNRSKTDLYFLRMIEMMNLNTTDLQFHKLPASFNAQDIDELHRLDRVAKVLEPAKDEDEELN